MITNVPVIQNRGILPLSAIPVFSPEDFREAVLTRVSEGSYLQALFGTESPGGSREDSAFRIFALLGNEARRQTEVFSFLCEESYTALTPDLPQAHLFEREIRENHRIIPKGHPWLKPVRDTVHPAEESDNSFFEIHGEDLHQVAVGPVHAGIIEPGHFRFNCLGEKVLHLAISLGYQHRGIERAIPGKPVNRILHLIETAAGDTTCGHALPFCGIIEALGEIPASDEAEKLRALALELERLANHAGDLGALSGDVGYLPTQSFCGRIRGDILNLTALLCGNRFGRGLIIPGGTRYNLDRERKTTLLKRLRTSLKELYHASDLLWRSPSVMARFEGCGTVDKETALSLGLVGPAARASGLERDCRKNFPSPAYIKTPLRIVKEAAGDVYSRAFIRRGELEASAEYIEKILSDTPDSPSGETCQEKEFLNPASLKYSIAPDHLAFAMEEGWRGEVCHAAVTDRQGNLRTYKIIDPSFRNWAGLALAMRQQEISDFPLCNKSFNLSYCGHDL